MTISFRPLKASEIKIRVDRITKKGAWLLLYKDARVDMDMLDETVGPENWQRSHKGINNNLFCGVSIWSTEKNQWVYKDDVGTETFTAKEKGESSDSFKRACVNWGIGRELYTAPNIFAPCETEPKDPKDPKCKVFYLKDAHCLNDISVSHILTVDGRIKELAVVDKKGMVIFSNMGKSKRPVDPTEPEDDDIDINAKINSAQKSALVIRLEKLKYPEQKICDNYGLKTLGDMTIVQLADCSGQLTRIEDKRKKEKGEIE